MDDLWYSEYHTPDVRFSIKVKRQLHSEESDYQTIAVFESTEFGRFLTLDGVMTLTERDEFVFHEMIAHPALAVNPEIKKALVIGSGDGGVVRELIKYKTIEAIDVVEIDERVVEVCKKFLPKTAHGFADSRVNLHFQDGLRFVRRTENAYDLIIVDSTDSYGPGEVLFTREFYGNCYRSLTEKGILINQHESPFYKEDAKAMIAAHRRISNVFPVSQVYLANIPTYPSGQWLFWFASKGLHPLDDLKAEEWEALGLKTDCYNTALHWGAFALPNYIGRIVNHE